MAVFLKNNDVQNSSKRKNANEKVSAIGALPQFLPSFYSGAHKLPIFKIKFYNFP